MAHGIEETLQCVPMTFGLGHGVTAKTDGAVVSEIE